MLFSAPMVRALLDGRKTQTRRVLARKPITEPLKYAAGDRIWVRETWQGLSLGDYLPTKTKPWDLRYAATDREGDSDASIRGYPWRPSIHMPRIASRITLDVTEVKVERLRDISREDAIAEGLKRMPNASDHAVSYGCDWGYDGDDRYGSPISTFSSLWDSINGKPRKPGGPDISWEANPWVIVPIFTMRLGNIDG